MLNEAKKNKKTKKLSDREKMKEFWKMYPVVINPPQEMNVGYNKASLGWDQIPQESPQKDMSFSESYKTEDDPDLEGHQKASYYKGLSNKEKEIRQKEFKKGAAKSHKDPSAYPKSHTGDEDAKTKLSKYTKKYRKMFGEQVGDLVEEIAFKTINDVILDETYGKMSISPNADSKSKMLAYNMISLASMASLIAGKMLSDANFASKNSGAAGMFNQCLTRALNIVMAEPSIVQQIRMNINNTRIFESIELFEDSSKAALQKKAEKSGIPYSILKKVYDRGLAAWRTGHRPGANQQQWGYARVNSFIVGGKTRRTADKDLWQKYKSSKKKLKEEYGAGEEGTKKLVNKYKKDTPGESVKNEKV